LKGHGFSRAAPLRRWPEGQLYLSPHYGLAASGAAFAALGPGSSKFFLPAANRTT